MSKRRFTVTGNPKGKDRPRFSTFRGMMRTYSSKATVDYEKDVKTSYLHSYSNAPMLEGALQAEINAYYLIPKSTPKKNIPVMLEENKVTKKPDCDNIAKIILDALNGIAYDDDKQVTTLIVKKHYTQFLPRVEIELKEV